MGGWVEIFHNNATLCPYLALGVSRFKLDLNLQDRAECGNSYFVYYPIKCKFINRMVNSSLFSSWKKLPGESARVVEGPK